LEREVNILKMEVADLKDQGQGGQASRYGGSSDLRTEVGNLRTAVQRLTENVETASLGGMSIRQQLEYLSARLDRLEKRAGLSPLNPSVVQPSGPPFPTATPVLPEPPTGGPDQSPSPPPVPPAPSVSQAVRTDYDEGKEFFDQKNYSQAMAHFKAYLASQPTGSQAAASQFYLGESLYFQNQYEDAILEYDVLVKSYPKDALVSAALLKQGLSFQAMGDKSSAKLFYQKVVREYPKSYSAGVARERLKTI
jgi:tol-pal system protein YbgF